MKTAAIYARFSSDLQKDKSIEDQVALCRDLCAANAMIVVGVFEDRAISGASTVNRPGFQAMMRAAERREFDVVVTEDVDRISRKQADFHTARDKLHFLGIGIHTPSGALGQIDGSLRALMSELYLDNLAAKTRRGLRGVLRDGRHAGGRAYGYRAVAGKPGVLEIDADEAEILREIFRRYAAGETPRGIARDLNRSQVPSPRGGKWNASTINGNRARTSGILFNDLYVGRIVWNRLHHKKDPATGRRVVRINPAAEFVSVDAPHLRIIDDATWEAVRARKASQHKQHPAQLRKPRRMLSGLIRCGSCGAGMASVARDRKGMKLQCSAHRESGTCGNGRLVYRDLVEHRVVEGLRAVVSDRAYLDSFVRAYNDERRALRQDVDRNRAQLERRASAIARELERAIDAIVKAGVDPTTLAARMRELEAEKITVAADLARANEAAPVIALHPAAMESYRVALSRMGRLLEAGENCDGLIDAVRAVVAAVIVHATPGRGGAVRIEIRGRLSELTEDVFASRSLGGGKVVAGVGFEPTTFRL